MLLRIPTVFTLVANVTAGFLLVAQGPQPWPRLVFVLLGSVLMYWAGMILNDVFDVERDRVDRPSAVLPSGRIKLRHAQIAGWISLLLGCLIAGSAGWIPADNFPSTGIPMTIAAALALGIVLYDGPLKRTPIAPGVMGACRGLSFLLAGSVALPALGDAELPVGHVGPFPRYLAGTAIGFAIYVTGLTAIARHEVKREALHGPHLKIGAMLVLIGTFVLAFVPRTDPDPPRWFVDRALIFPALIGMMSFPVIRRAFSTASSPSPGKIGVTVRSGLFNLIPLSACFAVLGVGVQGIAIFVLVVPAFWTAQRFRMT